MAVTDLDTPLHQLMEYLEKGDNTRLTSEFTDFVMQDFEERVRVIQLYSKEKRSFIFLKSFITKVRRKQYDVAKDHLRSARQEYGKFILQYDSLIGRKKSSAIKPYPQPKDNVQKPIVIPKEAPAAQSSPLPVYTPLLPQNMRTSPRPISVPRSEIKESLQQPPLEMEPERPESDRMPSGTAAVTGAEEAGPKQIEKERKIQIYRLSVTKTDEEKLITPEKRVWDIKPKTSLHGEIQDEVLPWLPAPEDVRPNFVDVGDDDDPEMDIVNRYGPTIQDSHLYSNVYDAYK
ncbi:hypothetical protein CHS0354_026414 [Potamilus streckersoni]|uniref:Uncharacterized protein n=1 Tax=Potamilus streckersoni TaxID=2493646 RepID=A0AAE0T3T6_9BIVA|nr:hypothetical protein CHS0354_026414 [Potamilus streckersoni]